MLLWCRGREGSGVLGQVAGQIACAQRVGEGVGVGAPGEAQAGELQAAAWGAALLPGRGLLVCARALCSAAAIPSRAWLGGSGQVDGPGL
jgi:hypothetical protein